jgi:hypothetical protein
MVSFGIESVDSSCLGTGWVFIEEDARGPGKTHGDKKKISTFPAFT